MGGAHSITLMKAETGGKQTRFSIINATQTTYTVARYIPADKCQERASPRYQLAGLAGSSLDCCSGWAGITQSAKQRLQTCLYFLSWSASAT